MRQRTRLALAAGLLGALALWWLFPRYDLLAGLGRMPFPREVAIAKAKEVARTKGIDATHWSPAAQANEWRDQSWIYYWHRLHPASPVFGALVTPYVAEVTLRQPNGDRYVMVTFNSKGRLVGFTSAMRFAAPVGHVHPSETLDAMASGVLAEYLGPQASLFRPANRGVTQGSQLLYSWEYSDPQDSPHLLRFEASFSEEQLVRAEVTTEAADSFRDEVRERQRPQSYLFALMLVVDFALLTAAFPSFFRALVRNRLQPRRLVSVLAMALVMAILAFRGGSWWDEAASETARQFTGMLNRSAGFGLALVLLSCASVLFYGAGRGLLLPHHHHRWLALEAMLDRRFAVREIGAALFHGVLCGAALAALPLLVAPWFTAAQPWLGRPAALYAFSPLATVFEPALLIDVIAVVLFILPLSRRIRPAWLGLPLYLTLIPANWFIMRSPFDDWATPGLCAAFLFALGIWLIESEYGALASLVAGASMIALWTAGGFFVQASPALAERGWWIAGPTLLTGLAGLIWMRAGQAVNVADEVRTLCAETASDVRSQRDRLTSEFDVARRAQQAMLPAVPAQLGEVSLSATCIPARDVGGDLFDFYATGDGRYALGVADVSGKGVPASLYMTLTKGFLAAAGRDSTDLTATLSQLNTHLYAAGKRKIFVTMAFAFFSPNERRISLARAGHNSPLWRRASRGASEYLTPSGMGLGLTSRLLFERALKVQEIALEPGDAFILYSDGVTEAMNEEREQFGEERLQAVVDACDGCDAHATEQAILQAVRTFIGTAPPHDDMTLFVVRV